MDIADQPHIAFLVGKPLRANSVIAEVIHRLHRDVPTITIHRPVQGQQLPSLVFECDLVVQRGLYGDELDSAIQMESAGVRCINSAVSTQALGNRATVMTRLDAAGLPIPNTVSVDSWKDVVELSGKRPLAVKARDGETGRGLRVLLSTDGNVPSEAPFDGPFIVQEYVPSNAAVRKVYVVGRHVRGLLKNAGSSRAAQDPSVPIDLDAGMVDLALFAGAALNIEIYGVDFLIDVGDHFQARSRSTSDCRCVAHRTGQSKPCP